MWCIAIVVLVIVRNAAPQLFETTGAVVGAIIGIVVSLVVIFTVQFATRSQLAGEIEKRNGVYAKRIGRENFFAVARFDRWLEFARARANS